MRTLARRRRQRRPGGPRGRSRAAPPDPLAGFGLLSDLDPGEREFFASQVYRVDLVDGMVLARQGEPVDRVYFLLEGLVEVEARAPGDREVTLRTVSAGATLGELALNGPHLRTGTLTARGPGRALVLPLPAFEAMRSAHHPVAFKLLRRLALCLCDRLREPEGQPQAGSKPPGRPPGAGPSDPSDAHMGLLRTLPFFRAFREEEVREVLGRMLEWRLPRGAAVFREGEEGRSCFVVARGAVEVGTCGAGHPCRLAVLGPGRMFGEVALLTGGPRTASCVARENAVLLEIPGAAFEDLYARQSPLALKFLQALNSELIASLRRQDRRRVGAALGEVVGTEEARLDWERSDLAARITRSEVGEDLLYPGRLWARRRLVLDLAAPARPLSFLEEFLRDELAPLVADRDHGPRRASRLVEETRRLAAESVGAGPEEAVGLTFLPKPRALLAVAGAPACPVALPRGADREPWEAAGWTVAEVALDPAGRVDPQDLAEVLRSTGSRLACLPACASTGALQDLSGLAEALRGAGARALWDLEIAFPHLDPAALEWDRETTRAVYLSLAHLVGGFPSPGVLVGRVPMPAEPLDGCGALAAARGGLALHLHASVGPAWAARRAEDMARRAWVRWSRCAGLEVGPEPGPGLPVVPVRGGPGWAAALREVFGLQVGVGPDGWLLPGFPYYLSRAGFAYALEALELAGRHPERLTEALEAGAEPLPDDPGLADLCYHGGSLVRRTWRASEPESALARYLEEARAWLEGP